MHEVLLLTHHEVLLRTHNEVLLRTRHHEVLLRTHHEVLLRTRHHEVLLRTRHHEVLLRTRHREVLLRTRPYYEVQLLVEVPLHARTSRGTTTCTHITGYHYMHAHNGVPLHARTYMRAWKTKTCRMKVMSYSFSICTHTCTAATTTHLRYKTSWSSVRPYRLPSPVNTWKHLFICNCHKRRLNVWM